MNGITNAYSFGSHENQEYRGQPVDILDIAVELCPASEVRTFLDTIPEPPSVTEARWSIILAWENGAIGAVEALNALEAHGCLYDADEFMASWVTGTKARLMLGDEPPPAMPPEASPVHPGPAKGVRATSHAQTMIEALADVRRTREVAA